MHFRKYHFFWRKWKTKTRSWPPSIVLSYIMAFKESCLDYDDTNICTSENVTSFGESEKRKLDQDDCLPPSIVISYIMAFKKPFLWSWLINTSISWKLKVFIRKCLLVVCCHFSYVILQNEEELDGRFALKWSSHCSIRRMELFVLYHLKPISHTCQIKFIGRNIAEGPWRSNKETPWKLNLKKAQWMDNEAK